MTTRPNLHCIMMQCPTTLHDTKNKEKPPTHNEHDAPAWLKLSGWLKKPRAATKAQEKNRPSQRTMNGKLEQSRAATKEQKQNTPSKRTVNGKLNKPGTVTKAMGTCGEGSRYPHQPSAKRGQRPPRRRVSHPSISSLAFSSSKTRWKRESPTGCNEDTPRDKRCNPERC